MKRANNLYANIADMENLRLAYWKAQRGKAGKTEVKQFAAQLNHNLQSIHHQLSLNTFDIGHYHYFTIYDPKERVICAASFPERVLHHAVMNICHPVFEQYQIYDSYATRPGKGQYAALDRARQFNKNNTWFCKLDIKKYFDSIAHDILYQKLTRKFKEPELLNLFRTIIKSYQVTPHKGIPIGNLTSQYFANHFLSMADHYIKEQLNAKYYVRYMDDMVIWHNEKEKLESICEKFTRFIEKELHLHVKPPCMQPVSKGLPFLGYVLFRTKTRLNKTSKKRFQRKLRHYTHQLETNNWSQSEYANHVTPLIAFTQYAATKTMRNHIINREGIT